MRYLLVLQVVAAGRSYRGLMVWCGHRRGNGACAAAVAQGHKPQLVEGGDLWRRSSLYALDAYAGTQSEGNGDVPVFPHFVYIVYHKIWRLSKMETGRKRKEWKILEGAGLREMDTRGGACGREWKGG